VTNNQKYGIIRNIGTKVKKKVRIMAILYGGTVYYKNDIVFEDNTFDMKSAHPVLVLFTTDEYDENAYVLPMTSDRGRARDNREYYTTITYNKKSFLNLSHILKTPNNIRKKYEYISISEYERVLSEFYKYQSNNKKDSNFNKIKDRIEIILKMLQAAKENEEVKEFFINNTNLQKYMINNNIMTSKTKEQVMHAIVQMRSKENHATGNGKNMAEVILAEFDGFNTYLQQNSYLGSTDFIDNTSSNYKTFKQYYTKLQSKYPMINVEQLLLSEVAMAYRDDKSDIKIAKLNNIEQFIETEQKTRKEEIAKSIERDKKKQLDKMKKSAEKFERREAEKKKKNDLKRKKKTKKDKEKYGNFIEF